jgi:uncharacterized protein (DUF1697 family)
MARYVALLRAVNVGGRRVAMATARAVLEELGYLDVGSYVNSGNLSFKADGKADAHERRIREALEDEFGFELTTFVRIASQVRALVDAKPFGRIAPSHTHFVVFPLTEMTAKEKRAVRAMSNSHDELIIRGRDVHWLIRSRSPETTLGPRQWNDAARQPDRGAQHEDADSTGRAPVMLGTAQDVSSGRGGVVTGGGQVQAESRWG